MSQHFSKITLNISVQLEVQNKAQMISAIAKCQGRYSNVFIGIISAAMKVWVVDRCITGLGFKH